MGWQFMQLDVEYDNKLNHNICDHLVLAGYKL